VRSLRLPATRMSGLPEAQTSRHDGHDQGATVDALVRVPQPWRHPERRRGGRRATDPVTELLSAGDSATDLSPVWEFPERRELVAAGTGLRALRKRHVIQRRALAVADVIAAYLALLLAVLVVPGESVTPRLAAILVAPFIVMLSKAIGLYDRDEHRLCKTTLDETPSLVHLAVFYALAVWLAQGVVVAGELSRAQVFGLAVSSLGLFFVCRAVARSAAAAANPPERCLVVGTAADASRTAAKLRRSPGVKARIVGHLTIGGDGLAVPDGVSRLPSLIREHAVERVIIVPDGRDEEVILHCIRLVKAVGVKVSVVPRLLEVVGTSAVFDEVEGTILLGVRQYGLSKSSELLKRLTDLVVAGLGLVVLSPLMAVVAILICLDSPGRPLFRQSRIGRHGNRFSMLKFRSMVRGADSLRDEYRGLNDAEGGLFKIVGDPRVTRVGRFLRQTSLDELPQLINVLRGDMSLVGPRPLVADEDALIEGWQRRRLAVKPGMTGLWQIFGSTRIPLPEMVKIDYLYGANWSVWLDLKILLRTVPHVLSRRGV
jgi:exopolysaccharide biosynthesis polyprenyl glycosylphosphotransferase